MNKAILAIIAVLLALNTSSALAASAGEELFKSAKCSNCHNTSEKKKVGPGLAGLMQRTNEVWVRAWLADSVAVWTANEAYTVTLKATMKKEASPKPSHKTRKLEASEIDALVEFLKTL